MDAAPNNVSFSANLLSSDGVTSQGPGVPLLVLPPVVVDPRSTLATGITPMNPMAADQNRRVLVIDDHRAIHEDFRKILTAGNADAALDASAAELFEMPVPTVRKADYEIDSAYQGQEGVALVQRALEAGRPYALVFVDVRMPPGWDGVETIQKIRALDPEVQVVLCTAYSDHSWEEIFEKVGEGDGLLILKKPFDPAEALQLAHVLTEKWRLYRQARQKVEALEIFVAERTRELRASEARFRSVTQSVGDAIISAGCDGNIIFWNHAAEKIFGYSEDEVLGRPLALIMPEWFREADRAGMQRLQAGGESPVLGRTVELVGLAKGDREFPIELTLSSSGAGAFYTGVVRDITERKISEQQVLRTQRMESIGTLAGGIAHDLNNALSPIIMSLSVLEKRLPSSDDRELLAIVQSSAQRGADMVRQVLSFARGVEGRRMEVQVKHLVGEIEKIASDTFLKHIEVRTNVPRDLWTVLGDPTQLHQVLLNLCVNARDAMPGGGRLTMSAENLTLDAHYAGMDPGAQPGPYVLIQVEDTGAGMPPAVMEKIFDPFFTTKEVGHGTGLGLSTSLAIIKSHGGFIRVYSEAGRGAKFRIYLPAQTETLPPTTAALEPERPHGHGELILVVDDEFAVRQVTRTTLETFGYRVVLASEGSEAIAAYAARGTEIAVMLTDLMMPGIDGAATIRVLRRMNRTLPIIAASGLMTDDQVAVAASQGVKHFLAKPYTAETLLNLLQEILTAQP